MGLKKELENKEAIQIIWCIDDVKAMENELSVELTDEERKGVLQSLLNHIAHGISWCVLAKEIQYTIENRDKATFPKHHRT